MNAFDIRMKTGLFPEPPASYAACVQNALNMTGAQTKPKRRFSVAHIAIAAAAVAASLAVILLGAALHNGASDVRPGSSAGTSLQTTPPVSGSLPLASMEPGWTGSTRIFSAVSQEGRFTEEDTDRYGKIILSFLRDCGESEPEELWILIVRSTLGLLPENDTGSYMSCVLVLAQSRFEAGDGPDLYCIQTHADGEVLWGTQDGSSGAHRVLGTVYGQQRWWVFGSNTDAFGTSLGHMNGGYLTGGEPGTDVEFSAFLSTDANREPFRNSKYFDRLFEYYLVTDGMADTTHLLNRSLLLVTEQSNYAYPIRDNVPEMQVLTAADARAMRENREALVQRREELNGTTAVFNLSNQSKETAEAYAEAVLHWLKVRGTEPDELWICGAALFAFREEDPPDDAYVLCMYEFDGETGPELFYYKNNAILWQTKGYDPYCINTVYDPILKMNCLFGFSPAYDNGPLAMENGQFTAEQADTRFADDSTRFYPERPLAELSKLLSGSKHTEWMRECFIFPYPKAYTLQDCVFTTEDGRTFSAPDGVKVLTVKSEPVF